MHTWIRNLRDCHHPCLMRRICWTDPNWPGPLLEMRSSIFTCGMPGSKTRRLATPSRIGRRFGTSSGFDLSDGIGQANQIPCYRNGTATSGKCGVQETQKQRHVKLPIGKAAKMVFELDALRAQCSQAAKIMLSQNPVDGLEFEECARLDDALAQA